MSVKRFYKYPSTYVLSVMMVLITNIVIAAEWRSSKGLNIDTTYTDNRDLSSENEEGEFSLGVTPSLGITGRGGRLTLDFRYAPGIRIRQHEGNSFDNNLASSLTSELYRDVLFLDASANARQTLENSNGRSGGDNVNSDNDTTQTYTYSISPYTRHHFGAYADSTLRYTFNGVVNNGEDNENSIGHRLDYSINSGRRFPDTPWSLNAHAARVEYENDNNDTNEYVARGTVGYVINRIWQLDLYGLYENYETNVNNNDNNGFGGGAGFTWTPNERTFLKFAYGYRVIGWNAYFDFSYRSRRSTWTASLTHDVISSRDEQLAQETFDEDGDLVFDPDAPNLEDGADFYVLDRLQTSYTLQGRRNSLTFSGFISEREYATSNREQRNYGLSARFGHSLSANTGADIGVSWDRSREDSDEDYDTNWSVGTGLTHQLGANTNLRLRLRHLKRDADISTDDYTENRISLTLGRTW